MLLDEVIDVVEGFLSPFGEALQGDDLFFGGVWKEPWVDVVGVEIAQVLDELFAESFDELESSHDARCVPWRKGGVVVDGDDAA